MYKENLGCSTLMWAYNVKLFHIFTSHLIQFFMLLKSKYLSRVYQTRRE